MSAGPGSEVSYGRKCLLHDLAIATEGLLAQAHHINNDVVVMDDDVHLQLFCATMEAVFLYGFQGIPEGFFNSPCGYDRLIKDLPTFFPDAGAAVMSVWAIPKIKTANGRGRAFVKFALIEKKLDLYLLALTHNVEYINQFYVEGALLRSTKDAAAMNKMLASLRAVNFSLFLKESDTSIETERVNIGHLGVRTGKLDKTEMDQLTSECSWCLHRSVHSLISEDMQQIYRCQMCEKLTMICYNHCGAMARCLPNRKLQEATCAVCASDVHGWKEAPASALPATKLDTSAAAKSGNKKGKTVKTKTVALDGDVGKDDVASSSKSVGRSTKPPKAPAASAVEPDVTSAKASHISIKATSTSAPVVKVASAPGPAIESNNEPAEAAVDDSTKAIFSVEPVAEVTSATGSAQKEDDAETPSPTDTENTKEEEKVNLPPPIVSSSSNPSEPTPALVAPVTQGMSSSSFARSLEFAKPLVDQIAEQKEQALQKETLTATAPTPLVSATPSPLVSKPPSPLPLPLSTSQDRIGLVVSTEPADSNFGGSKGKLFDDLFHINETDDEKTKELKRKLRDRVKQKSISSGLAGLDAAQEQPTPADDDVDLSQYARAGVQQPSSPILAIFGSGSSQSMLGRQPESPTRDRFKYDADVEAEQAVPANEVPMKRDHWMKDEDANVCSIQDCGVRFSFFNRRHHCRRCGDIVCDKHSKKTLKLNVFAVPDPNGTDSRVCDDCYDKFVAKPVGRQQSLASLPAADATRTERATSDASVRSASAPAMPGLVLDQVSYSIPVKPKKVPEHCAICGSSLSKGLLANVRYCEANGVYCCNNCHSGGKAVVPAYVLTNWNFSLLEVCNRSRVFLASLYEQPMYNIDAINPSLYNATSKLRPMKALSEQFGHLQSFVLTCNANKSEKLEKNMPFISAFDPMHYSMKELVELHEGTLIDFVTGLNKEMTAHVFSCDLCKAKGFICEICRDRKPLYSFQTQLAEPCPNCKAFFHIECRQKQPVCPRCARRSKGSTSY